LKSTHDTIFEIHAMGLPFSLKSPTILDPAAMLSDRLSFSDMHAYIYISRSISILVPYYVAGIGLLT